jgi:hypothetical protein
MTLPKGEFVSFDLRDEHSDALWLLTSEENNRRLAPALVELAQRVLAPETLPRTLEGNLMRIVATPPSRHKDAYLPFAAADALIYVKPFEQKLNETSERLYKDHVWQVRKRWRASREWNRAQAAITAPMAGKLAAIEARRDLSPQVRQATDKLMADRRFRNQLIELAQNYVVHVAVPAEPITRRIVKLTSERSVTFWSRTSKLLRLLQGLGWKSWPLRIPIGGRGGSHHLEVAAPPGVDVVRIVARPRPRRSTEPGEPRARTLSTDGFQPHVHISIPAILPMRYRATIYVRASRSGWLLASFLVGIVIAVVMMLGRHYVSDLFRTSGTASPEAGTAATLLLTLLGVIALWLIRPGEHPLASRLLLLVRVLILIDVADLLIGTGDLVLHTGRHPPTPLWSGLAWAATVIAVVLTLSWLMPRRLPWSGGNRDRPGYAEDDGGEDR